MPLQHNNLTRAYWLRDMIWEYLLGSIFSFSNNSYWTNTMWLCSLILAILLNFAKALCYTAQMGCKYNTTPYLVRLHRHCHSIISLPHVMCGGIFVSTHISTTGGLCRRHKMQHQCLNLPWTLTYRKHKYWCNTTKIETVIPKNLYL